jgi:hypothetical protein
MADARIRALERAAALGDPEAQSALSRAHSRRDAGLHTFEPWNAVLAAADDPHASVELPPSTHRLLESDLEPLAGLAAAARAFVVEGDRADVLAELAEARGPARDLDLKANHHEGAGAGRDSRPVLESLPPLALLRLGMVYLAAVAPLHVGDQQLSPLPSWLALLIRESIDGPCPQTYGGQPLSFSTCNLSLDQVAGAMTRAGDSPDRLVRYVLGEHSWNSGTREIHEAVASLSGFGVALAEEHAERVAGVLDRDHHENRRARLLEALARSDAPLEVWMDSIARCSVHRNHRLRAAAAEIVYVGGVPARQSLLRILDTGYADARLRAVGYLRHLPLPATRQRFTRMATHDRSPRVRRACAEAIAGWRERDSEVDWTEAVDAAPSSALATLAEIEGAPVGKLADLWEQVSAERAWTSRPHPTLTQDVSALLPLAERGDLTLTHLLRLACCARRLSLPHTWDGVDDLLRASCEARGAPLATSDVARAAAACALDPRSPALLALSAENLFSASTWNVSEFYRADPDALVDAIEGERTPSQWLEIQAALRQLKPLPKPLVRPLFARALGKANRARVVAQIALDQAPPPELNAWLYDALDAQDEGTRCMAARWLGQRRPRGWKTLFRATLRAEKGEKVRRALRDALQG